MGYKVILGSYWKKYKMLKFIKSLEGNRISQKQWDRKKNFK